MKPTLKHRPAVWEAILGTVYAVNDKGVAKYFGYKHNEALKYADVDKNADNRFARTERTYNYNDYQGISRKQFALWIPKKVIKSD